MSYDERLKPTMRRREWPEWLKVFALIGGLVVFCFGILWIASKDRSDWDRVKEWKDGGMVVGVDHIGGDNSSNGTLIRTETHTFTAVWPLGTVPLNVRAQYGETKRNGSWITFDGDSRRYRLRD